MRLVKLEQRHAGLVVPDLKMVSMSPISQIIFLALVINVYIKLQLINVELGVPAGIKPILTLAAYILSNQSYVLNPTYSALSFRHRLLKQRSF